MDQETVPSEEYDWSDIEEVFEFDSNAKFCVCNDPDITGDLVVCEGTSCETTWFHVGCVGVDASILSRRKWFCDECTSDSSTQEAEDARMQQEPNSEQQGTSKHPQVTRQHVVIDQSASDIPTDRESKPKERKRQKTSHGTAGSIKGSSTSEVHPTNVGEKKKAKGGRRVLSREKAKSMGTSIFQRCINLFFTEPLYSLETGRSKDIRLFAQHLKALCDSEHLEAFAGKIVEDMWEVIFFKNEMPITSMERGQMWSRFHAYRVNEKLQETWGSFLQMYPQMANNFSASVHDYVIQHILEHTIKLIIEEQQKHSTQLEDAKLSTKERLVVDKHEDQIIRYVAGYVPFVLKRRYSKLKSESAASYLKCLNSFAVTGTGNSFVEYTKDWVAKQNRGGLFVVNDKFFFFFRSLEYHTKKTLNMKQLLILRDADVQSLLFDKLLTESQIQRQWKDISKEHLDDVLQGHLLKDVVKMWVKIRVSAFVKVYCDVRKKKSSDVSLKKAKALRKTLVKSVSKKD